MFELDRSISGGRRTAHEYVRDSLRIAILRGSITGGVRLVQSEIARELGVSTTPVREALRDLATEGLIDLDAHRGAVVKKLDYPELVEIYRLTRLLEPEAMRLAAHAKGQACLDRAEELAEQMEAEDDIGQWVDLNRQFHESLATCVDSSRLLNILKGLREAAAPYTGLALQQNEYPRDLAHKHHRELIAALRDGDGERAAALASDHVDLTGKLLEDARDIFGGSLDEEASALGGF